MIWHGLSSIKYWSLFIICGYFYQSVYYSYLIRIGLSGVRMLEDKALRSSVIMPVLSFNHLIAIIFAYYNCKNNCYNHFVKPYRKWQLL